MAYTDPKSGSAGGKLIDSVLNKPEFANLKRVHNARVATGEVPIWLEAAGQLRGAYGVDEVGLVPASLNAHLQFSIAVGGELQEPAKPRWRSRTMCCSRSSAPIWTKWGVAR